MSLHGQSVEQKSVWTSPKLRLSDRIMSELEHPQNERLVKMPRPRWQEVERCAEALTSCSSHLQAPTLQSGPESRRSEEKRFRLSHPKQQTTQDRLSSDVILWGD